MTADIIGPRTPRKLHDESRANWMRISRRHGSNKRATGKVNKSRREGNPAILKGSWKKLYNRSTEWHCIINPDVASEIADSDSWRGIQNIAHSDQHNAHVEARNVSKRIDEGDAAA